MSWVALGWAASQKVQRAADKLVLIGLADRHNTERELAYPSLAWLCEFSSLDRKTVVTALGRLEAAGLIADSGERVGKTNQIKAYSLLINSSEKGTVKTAPLPKDADFSVKESQKRDTEPVSEPLPLVVSNETTPPSDSETKIKVTVDQLREAWNAVSAQSGAVECRILGPERTRKAKNLIKRYPVEDITEAIHAVARSDFLCGRGKSDFRADFDFLFSPKHMNRLLEGFYSNG